MQSTVPESLTLPNFSDAPDDVIVSRVLEGAAEWFAVLMRRYNGRLYRVARGVTGDDQEAEDAVQRAYLAAYHNLASFRGDAQVSTWLTTIVVREAWQRRRASERREALHSHHDEIAAVVSVDSPEDRASLGELRAVLEAAVDALPEHYRSVFVMRDVEELSSAEVATALDLTEQAVRVRLHRARVMLRSRVENRLDVPWFRLFEFGGERCDRIVNEVWEKLGGGARRDFSRGADRIRTDV